MEDLNSSMNQYNEQLSMVQEALKATSDEAERKSLLELESELLQLKQLTEESMNTIAHGETPRNVTQQSTSTDNVDDEYALFMQEMAKSGAYDEDNNQRESEDKPNDTIDANQPENDIEDDLSTLLGMKCAVYHTHKWGGQPSLYNAMVCAVVPRQDNDKFNDLRVRVLFTHPTHAEMLPCPFYLDGECRFDDDNCRYSHGAIVQLSTLKEAIEPNFESVRIGSRILLKLKPPDDEVTSLTKKSAEKYHLWHRAVVKHIDADKRVCIAKLEHGAKSGEKRKSSDGEIHVQLCDIFPLHTEVDTSSDSDSLSDTEYPQNKTVQSDEENHALLIEKSLQSNGPAMGEWERHTRGIGSKLMLAMGYVPGTGLGATGDGRVQPVEARVLPVGKSLDKCMEISERNAGKDPLKVEQRLKKLQKKEEERNIRAYEREKEREKRNVFNFLNRTLGDGSRDNEAPSGSTHIKQSSNKDLNVEHFKITEEIKRVEKELIKYHISLSRQASESSTHKSISMQILDKKRELSILKNKEQQIAKEQKSRKDKQKMTVF